MAIGISEGTSRLGTIQKGNSVSHYLIDFINFVSYNQDIKNIHAVLAVAVDFTKAFNRQNHNILVELLSDLGVPGWLLQIVIGFLENRDIEVFSRVKHLKRKGFREVVPRVQFLECFYS